MKIVLTIFITFALAASVASQNNLHNKHDVALLFGLNQPLLLNGFEICAFTLIQRSFVAAGIAIILPSDICMSMVSPLIEDNLYNSTESIGKRAGMVYSISTTGGILFTFLFGFFVIPRFGLILQCITTGLLLGLIPGFLIFKNGRKNSGFSSLFLY